MEEDVNEQPTFADKLIAQRYQLRRVLARGTTCVVLQGEDTTLRRPIAVKLTPPEQVEVYRAALLATATFAHPAAVLVLDAVQQDDEHYLIEEYVSGVSLDTLLERGLSSERAVNLGLQLARLIAYAHARGIVHGDLTPTSVLIEPDGTARVNNFCLPPDPAYFGQFADVEAQLARGLGGSEAIDPGPPLELGTPAADVRAIGLLLAQALTTRSPSGNVRTFGADVPADVRELVERLVIRTHPQSLTDILVLLTGLESAKTALAQRRADDEQETPPAVRRHRDFVDQAAPWSEADTQLNVGPWQAALAGSHTPPGAAAYVARAPLPTGPFDTPGMPGLPPDGAAIDQQVTVQTPMPLAPVPTPPVAGPWGQGVAWPQRPPSQSGPLRLPSQSGPLRPSNQSVPLRVPSMSGPLRPAGASGPLHPSAPSAPLPQRIPVSTGKLRVPTPTGPLQGYSNTPIQSYRVPAAIPWSDEPELQALVASASSRPLRSLSRPMARSGSLGMATLVLIGLLLFAICFVVGYFTPILIPFH